MKLNYIIADEEPQMHKVIENYCHDLDYMNLVGNCYHADEVITMIKNHQVDLIFLDLNMSKLDGLQFIKTLTKPIKIIIITSNNEFSLEGYELNISDYLLKPFTLERFLASLKSIQQNLTSILSQIKK